MRKEPLDFFKAVLIGLEVSEGNAFRPRLERIMLANIWYVAPSASKRQSVQRKALKSSLISAERRKAALLTHSCCERELEVF